MPEKEPNAATKLFWETRMYPILLTLWSSEKMYIFPEIRKMYENLAGWAINRFSHAATIDLQSEVEDRFIMKGGYSPMGALVVNGIPTLMLCVPLCEKLFREDCNEDEEFFETTFLIGFLHEMIHLAMDLVQHKELPFDRERMYCAEEVVWAITCEDIIQAFAKRGRKILPSYKGYADAWVRCGKNQLSPIWSAHIRGDYVEFRP